MANPFKALDLLGLDYLYDKIKEFFVAKETGKGLSTNDYTTPEKEKLAGLENPTIKVVKVNNSPLSPDGSKAVNIDLTDYALKTDLTNVYKYKGSKQTYSALPTEGNNVGDVWNIEQADTSHDIVAGDNVAWDGTKWDKLAGSFSVDTSGFATKEELAGKVDKVSGKQLSTEDYTTAEKQKLAGLNNYVHPNYDGSKHVPANGTNNGGKFLRATATAGTYEWADVSEVEAITTQEIDSIFTKV